MWRWIQHFRDRIADDFFPKNVDDFVDHWIAEERSRRSWGVYRSGELGGVITSKRIAPTVADFHCLFSPAFWGRDTVVPALGQACDIIFQDPEIDKLATDVFAKNHSIAGMIRHFGVTREGLLHGHTRQGGKLVDLQILGLQRERFYVVWHQQGRERDELVEQQRDTEQSLQLATADA
jgi:RimJ/RimL family protein N-acetyltransferase